MRVLVVGGGVIGLTSAYFLAREGAEVSVQERHGTVGSEASAASAGVLAPGHTASWASPAMLRRLPRIVRGRDPKMRVGRWDPDLLRWSLAFVRNCIRSRWALARQPSAAARVCEDTGIDCGLQAHGALFVHTDPAALPAHDGAANLLRAHGEDLRRSAGRSAWPSSQRSRSRPTSSRVASPTARP